MTKKGDIDQLVGKTITSYTFDKYLVTLICADGARYEIQLEDDGCGGNDSHAFFTGCDITPLIGRSVTQAWAENATDYDGANLMLKTVDTEGYIGIVHESNGYYSFGYEVIEVAVNRS